MSTFIIASLIVGGVVLGISSYLKQRGSCNDCNCSCPVKGKTKDDKSV